MFVAIAEYEEVEGAEEQVDAAIEEHQVEVGEGIFDCIGFFMAVVAQEDLQADDDAVQRGTDQE